MALACRRTGIVPAPEVLERELYWSTARHMLVVETLRAAGTMLANAAVPWLVFKGADLATRVYSHPGERVATDVDIAVPPQALATALTCLAQAGWFEVGVRTPDAEQLLEGERYALAVGQTTGLLVELHYRLWGWMPTGMLEAVLAASEPCPEWGATACRPSPEWAFLLAAVHAWQVVRPRPLAIWRDLERLAATITPPFSQRAVTLALEWGVQLPVALAAWQTATLWPCSPCAAIATALLPTLRPPEALVALRFARAGEAATPLGALVAARLLARRPSRLGWRSVSQVFWPADEALAMLALPGGDRPSRVAAISRSILRAVRQ